MNVRKFLVGLVALVLVGCSSDATPASPKPPETVPSLSRNETCAREAVAGASYVYDHQRTGMNDIVTAIGMTSKLYYITSDVLVELYRDTYQSGIVDALPMIESKAKELCSRSGDPVLTRGQFEALSRLVTTGNYLSAVTIFA